MSIYKDCDIRGIYGEEFDASEMRLIGRAIGRRLEGRSIVVAGDVRVSTAIIKEQLLAGLAEENAHIIDIGTAPTPVAYFAKSKICFDAYALAIVTASHNPAKYNGVKLMFGEYPPTPAEIKNIETEVKAEAKSKSEAKSEANSKENSKTDGQAEIKSGGKQASDNENNKVSEFTDPLRNYNNYERREVESLYSEHIRKLVKPIHGLKVVLDIGNGTTAGIAPRIYRSMGYEVIELFGDADGRFPYRNPNPADFKNLKALQEKVIETGADFGIAFDGDGDRAVFVDDKGRPVINEKSLIMLTERAIRNVRGTALRDGDALINETRPQSLITDTCAQERTQLSHPQFSIVYDQKCSKIVPEAIAAMGGEAILERSGHAFIKKTFLEHGSIMAGEISGHFFFGELGHDDGIYAGLCMGEYLQRLREEKCGDRNALGEGTEKITLAQLADRMPDPHISPDLRYRVPYDKMNEVLADLKAHYEALGMPISTYDGVRVTLPDGWLLVRKSVTEEAMTAKIEAQDDARIDEIIRELEDSYFNQWS